MPLHWVHHGWSHIDLPFICKEYLKSEFKAILYNPVMTLLTTFTSTVAFKNAAKLNKWNNN